MNYEYIYSCKVRSVVAIKTDEANSVTLLCAAFTTAPY